MRLVRFASLVAVLAVGAFYLVGRDLPPAAHAQETKKVPIVPGKITLEVEDGKRRVLVETKVCLRQGQLEQLLTRSRTKEHESILVVDVDVRELHKALLLAGAEAGSPVKFQPKFSPPSGSTIKVT